MKYLLCILLLAIFTSCEQKQAEIKKAKVGDIELAYYTRGSGEPLVMIMGFRGTMSVWDPALLERLEKYYTLVLFDNRGAGLSTDTEKDHTTVEQMAEDTANLIKSLGYSKANVLGWSMGSRVAFELAAQYPEMVKTLILCAPNPGGGHEVIKTNESFKKLTTADLTKTEGLSLLFPDSPEGKKGAGELVARLTKAVLDKKVPDDFQVSGRTVERQINALALWKKDTKAYEALSHLKTPTLVLGGKLDSLDSTENVKIVADRIPFAWLAFFPEAGHYFLSQNYENAADLIHVFIKSNE